MATTPTLSARAPWPTVPLARRMLLHHKPRFVLSVVGVGFAVVVMFMQIGFLTSLTESQRALMPYVRGEIVVVAKERERLDHWIRMTDELQSQRTALG